MNDDNNTKTCQCTSISLELWRALYLLQLLFIGLSLTNVIAWHPVWIFAPILFMPTIFVCTFVIVFVYTLISILIHANNAKD